MANEVTIPLLPCVSIDEIAAFYGVLGFTTTYRQLRPNPYLAVRREDLELHFAGIPGFDPEQSYGSCVVRVPDTGVLHRAFADGMRAAYGKVLVAGIPRMTTPRRRKNVDGLAGFSVVDPGGNWIRFFPAQDDAAAPPSSATKLGIALQNAVVQGDSRGDERQAALILDGVLRRTDEADAPAGDLVEVLLYRAELAGRLGSPDEARTFLARALAVPLDPTTRTRLAAPLAAAADLTTAISPAEP
ncbi:VOC family protein [Nonomuraea sp. NPDC050310]|uniref:VOC family protein n=1 Tax=Nonomuraea sp. NPDC050310 TaxID=3154935 RepID=UPI0033FD885C